MYILVPIIVLNAILNNRDFVNTYRLNIGGTPINLFDILLFVGLALAFFQRSRRYPTDAVHPLFLRGVMWLLIAAGCGCVAAGIYQEFDLRTLVAQLRNFLVLPLSAILGYFMLNYPRGGKSYAFWTVVAGVGAAIFTMIYFRGQGERVTEQKFDINMLRTVEYGVGCAGIAGAYLIYTMFSGNRQFPTFVAVALCGICVLGQSATLSRSDWISLIMCIGSVFFLLPKDSGRLGKFVKLALVVPLLGIFLSIGVALGAKATGMDFQRRVVERIESLLPHRETTKAVKAWDSRVNGAFREFQLFARSPIIGQGFGHPMIYLENGQDAVGYGHNTWTFEMFQTGISGLIGCGILVFGTWVIGRRMIFTGVDRTFILIGAVGAMTAVWFFFHGVMTASFNTPRPAMTLGLTFGAVMRARAMQLYVLRQMQEEQALWETGEYADESQQQYNEPVFGNWY